MTTQGSILPLIPSQLITSHLCYLDLPISIPISSNKNIVMMHPQPPKTTTNIEHADLGLANLDDDNDSNPLLSKSSHPPSSSTNSTGSTAIANTEKYKDEELDERDFMHPTRSRDLVTRLFKTLLLAGLAWVCFLETVRLGVAVVGKEGALPYSPANEALSYHPRRIWQDGDLPSRFEKPPSPELDQEWEDLLTGQNIRISPDEMHTLGENLTNRVQLEDGNYLGLMSVWHNLHCLDILRKVVNWEYYFPRLTEEERGTEVWSVGHLNHCIERIRTDLVCHADVAVWIPEWAPKAHHPDGMVMKANGRTTCVDWEGLDAWARKRALREGAYRLKVNPFEKGEV
ncbi:hypothetical protein P280DRAFT_512253 [Massarina eburnea CBS 473.64]|uniref:Uncharacterized protein n=1 Tax=Massarina eburnea CBS 473.64 TaxID=1395130 RepID=A0A6A6SDY1_9PLEO|nr:hypothetical protein P280DRAFT_512253 [Massarina eburnea CBS 473.64]